MIIKFDKFYEEINYKSVIAGGLLGLSTLAGCDDPAGIGSEGEFSDNQAPIEAENNRKKSKTGDWEILQKGQQIDTTTNSLVNIPNRFTMKESILSIGTKMKISANGQDYGTIHEEIFNITTVLNYKNVGGEFIAKARKKIFSVGSVAEVFDANGVFIGSIEQEILESLVSFYSIYTIKDENGDVIGKSKKIKILTNQVEIYDNSGDLAIEFNEKLISIGSKYNVSVYSGEIDKRLIIFVPVFITDSKNKSKE